ncbi:MAG: flagellar type III secretion system pore protein FliP [candidate division Zixibacteria bacterium]|jgi:flagellar biosynthetic protein FliP|nr:flagellar type III secretion system pore protein FliP [candidate division Zixibacteria bacterium]MCK4606009.1 flagellar type III secretion system pore protein FliP [candidate division Zixibacteria bacterium]
MKKHLKWVSLVCSALVLSAADLCAQTLPKVSVQVGEAAEPGDLSVTLQIIILMTVLALAPSILIMVTSFVRIVVVLSFLRHAMGIHQMPPNQLLVALALILTFFLMSPVVNRSYTEGIKPYLDKEITGQEAFDKATEPIKTFMLSQTREKDLALFVNIAGMDRPEDKDDIPLHVLVPGYVISELRTAFQIAFVLFIPFLVIDMVVASVLMSMGMMMLPPIIVSLPFKILLFVLVDGWYLLVKSLVESFHM